MGDILSKLHADNESDFLLGLLQQITDEASPGESGNSKLGTDYPTGLITSEKTIPSVQPTVVGASSEELESIKELIKFDHVYYKTNCAQSMKDIVKEEITPVVQIPEDFNEAKSVCQDIIETPKDIDLLKDFENLFDQEIAPALVPTNMDITNSVSKEKTIVKTEPKDDIMKPHVETFTDLELTDAFSTEDSLRSLSQPVAALSPLSVSCTDSGISDYNSDNDSRLNDLSSPLDGNTWQETFTELFPSLDWAI